MGVNHVNGRAVNGNQRKPQGPDSREDQMGELEGKVAIVTGATGGIGSATVRALAGAGAKVVVADVAGAPVAELAAEITAVGHEAVGATVDISNEASVQELITRALDSYGRLDIVDNKCGGHNTDGSRPRYRLDAG